MERLCIWPQIRADKGKAVCTFDAGGLFLLITNHRFYSFTSAPSGDIREFQRVADILGAVGLRSAIAALHGRFVGKAPDQLDIVCRVERAHMLLVVFAFASHGFPPHRW